MIINPVFVCIYDQRDNLLIPSITYQLLNQKKRINLLNIILEHDSDIISLYKNYFTDSTSVDFLQSDNQFKIFNTLYKLNYTHVIVVNKNCLYHQNFTDDVFDALKNQNISGIKSINSEMLCSIYEITKIVSYTIEELLLFKYNISLDYYISSNMYTCTYAQSSQFYEDSNCVFCEISHRKNNLRQYDSYIYVNKNNSKVYHINHSMMGYLIDNNNSVLTLNWLSDDPKIAQTISYSRQFSNNIFIQQ